MSVRGGGGGGGHAQNVETARHSHTTKRNVQVRTSPNGGKQLTHVIPKAPTGLCTAACMAIITAEAEAATRRGFCAGGRCHGFYAEGRCHCCCA